MRRPHLRCCRARDGQPASHINDKLDAVLAAVSRLEKHLLREISDSHGTPVFDVFQLTAEPGSIQTEPGRLSSSLVQGD